MKLKNRKSLLFLLPPPFHNEPCPVEVTSWNHNWKNPDIPSRNYELDWCSNGSFLLGNSETSQLVPSWSWMQHKCTVISSSSPSPSLTINTSYLFYINTSINNKPILIARNLISERFHHGMVLFFWCHLKCSNCSVKLFWCLSAV